MNILVIISIIWVSSEILLSKFMRSDSHKAHDRFSLSVLWITISISVTIGIILRRMNFVFSDQYTILIYNIGLGFICLGLLIRWLAIVKLKKSFTVNVSIPDAQRIIQTGIYKYIRHPAYLGSLFSFLGLGFVFNNWITFIVIFIPIFFSFLYRIYVEEELLTQVFGKEYTDYINRSWRLIPCIY